MSDFKSHLQFPWRRRWGGARRPQPLRNHYGGILVRSPPLAHAIRLAKRDTETANCPDGYYSVFMVRFISISSINLILRSALLSLSKDARVLRFSKDGHKRERARGHPSRRPREERGLLKVRSEGLNSIVRCDWFHGIDPILWGA